MRTLTIRKSQRMVLVGTAQVAIASNTAATVAWQPQKDSVIRVVLGMNARIHITTTAHGNASMSGKIVVDLQGKRSEAMVTGIFSGSGTARHVFDVTFRHTDPCTKGDILIHGAYEGHSVGVFRGLIAVGRTAHQTVSRYAGHALIFGNSHAMSIPSLEIEADDVRVSHSADIRTASEAELFYLSSRGIQPRSARRIIAESFLCSARERIRHDFGAGAILPKK